MPESIRPYLYYSTSALIPVTYNLTEIAQTVIPRWLILERPCGGANGKTC